MGPKDLGGSPGWGGSEFCRAPARRAVSTCVMSTSKHSSRGTQCWICQRRSFSRELRAHPKRSSPATRVTLRQRPVQSSPPEAGSSKPVEASSSGSARNERPSVRAAAEPERAVQETRKPYRHSMMKSRGSLTTYLLTARSEKGLNRSLTQQLGPQPLFPARGRAFHHSLIHLKRARGAPPRPCSRPSRGRAPPRGL